MKLIESKEVEFKVQYTEGVIREIVAFLNADGGKIYISA